MQAPYQYQQSGAQYQAAQSGSTGQAPGNQPQTAAQYAAQMVEYQQQMAAYQTAQLAAGHHAAAEAAAQQLAQVTAQAAAAGVHIPPQSMPYSSPSGPVPSTLAVNGFSGQLINLNGSFQLSHTQSNHDRPVYEKVTGSDASSCVIYYWDLRDGPDQNGWWIAPEVGGAHVWTLNNSNAPYPPESGWRVPFRGPVDTHVTVSPMESQGKGSQPGYGQRQQEYDGQGYNQGGPDRGGFGRGFDRRDDRGRGFDDRRPDGNSDRYDRGNYGYDRGYGGQANWGQKRGWDELDDMRKRQQMEEDPRRMQMDDARKAEVEARQSANEQMQAQAMQQNIEQQLKDTDELFQKAKENYVFEGAEVNGKPIEEINELAHKCSNFEYSTRPMIDLTTKTKRIIDNKIVDLTRRIQQAQALNKPWLSVLADSKTQMEAFGAQLAAKQHSIQEMLNTCRTVQNVCRSVQREAEERMYKEEQEKQAILGEEMMSTGMQLTDAMEEAFKIARMCAEKYDSTEKEIWKLTEDELVRMVTDCGNSYTMVNKRMTAALTFLEDSLTQINNMFGIPPRIPSGPMEDARSHLTDLKNSICAHEGVILKYAADLAECEEILYEKAAFLIKSTLQSKIQAQAVKEDAFFESIATDGLLTWNNFAALFKEVSINANYLRRVYDQRLFPGTAGVDFAAFQFFQKVMYRVSSTIALTEVRVPTTSQHVRTLEIGEGVEACDSPEYIEESRMWRVKARALVDGENVTEGYISVRGVGDNSNYITYLEPFTARYKCVKDTIMSDSFCLKKFKTIRRLKVDDECWAVGVPRKEGSVGVMRIEVRMLNHTDRGFITLRGNQGSNFLEPAATPMEIEEIPDSTPPIETPVV